MKQWIQYKKLWEGEFKRGTALYSECFHKSIIEWAVKPGEKQWVMTRACPCGVNPPEQMHAERMGGTTIH